MPSANPELVAGFTREDLNKVEVQAPDFNDESRHFITCETCGQAVDRRKLGDVLYHEQAEHDPLPVG